MASAVAFVTGQQYHENDADLDNTPLDYRRLAQFPGTLVFYMGVTTAPEWSRALIDAGKSADTPAAVIRRCSWSDQVVRHCTLGEISDVLAPGAMRPPVIVILGPVTEVAEALDWFAKRPLYGRQVLVTRPRDQAASMISQLTELGANVLLQPAIEITDPDDWQPVDEAIENLPSYDWLIFSSANGVRFFLDRLLASQYDVRRLGSVRLAVVGPATAEELQRYKLRADLQPDEYRAEALAAALGADVSQRRVLLARASRGREVLAEQLTAAGATVDQIVVYRSSDVTEADEQIVANMRAGKIDFTTVTSSAIARSLVQLFGDDLRKTHLVTISPLTSETLGEQGHEAAGEALEYTTDGVIDALLRLR
jgi:uroporphyrinogen III methyltransferase/synthase